MMPLAEVDTARASASLRNRACCIGPLSPRRLGGVMLFILSLASVGVARPCSCTAVPMGLKLLRAG